MSGEVEGYCEVLSEMVTRGRNRISHCIDRAFDLTTLRFTDGLTLMKSRNLDLLNPVIELVWKLNTSCHLYADITCVPNSETNTGSNTLFHVI